MEYCVTVKKERGNSLYIDRADARGTLFNGMGKTQGGRAMSKDEEEVTWM